MLKWKRAAAIWRGPFLLGDDSGLCAGDVGAIDRKKHAADGVAFGVGHHEDAVRNIFGGGEARHGREAFHQLHIFFGR